MSKQQLWNYPLEDIIRGYTEKEYTYCCVLCGKQYEKGRIYSMGKSEDNPGDSTSTSDSLYDAFGAVCAHVQEEHIGTADYLLEQPQVSSLTGISEVQRQLLQLMSAGQRDQEIGKTLGIAPSTVRNHRFRLREREKQAKLFLAMMQSLEQKPAAPISMSDEGEIEELSMSAAMIDERYGITSQEREKTIKTYLDETGALKQFPAKEKKKIIVLGEIAKSFQADRTYMEREVNRILKRIYEEDYPTIRRALIEYGFMERSADCQVYRVKL